MTDTITDLARRMADTALRHANSPALAFDAEGNLIDWKALQHNGWVNGTPARKRVYTCAGGAPLDCIHALITGPNE